MECSASASLGSDDDWLLASVAKQFGELLLARCRGLASAKGHVSTAQRLGGRAARPSRHPADTDDLGWMEPWCWGQWVLAAFHQSLGLEQGRRRSRKRATAKTNDAEHENNAAFKLHSRDR